MATPTPMTAPAELKALMERFDTFLFDCDGVIWLGNDVIAGVPQVIAHLKACNKRVFYVTNNSTKSREEYLAKFAKLGIQATKQEIMCTAFAVSEYVKNTIPAGKKVYVIGDKGIEDEMHEAGITTIGGTEKSPEDFTIMSLVPLKVDPEVGAVVVGLDRRMDYYRLTYGFLCVKENPGCKFIATNTDAQFPLKNRMLPGGGAFVASLATALEQEPVVVGKPEPHMLQHVIDNYGLDKSRTCMVGDRLNTDIEFGARGGVSTLLVLTGATSLDQVPDAPYKPDFVIQSLGDLAKVI